MKKGIIVVSFGTTFEETRKKTIELLEKEIKNKFSDYIVTKAFTSKIVINRLKEKGIGINNLKEALEKMKIQGIQEIYIQPSLIIEGHEYEKILREVENFKSENQNIYINVGLPLLSEKKDYKFVVEALDLKDYEDNEALILMGHGTDHLIDKVYNRLENKFIKLGYKNIFVGTIEGSLTLNSIMHRIDKKVKYIELRPFMLVAGDHAINDMASDEEGSWKSILKNNGYDVRTSISGLGEVKKIRDIFVKHLEEIL